MGYSRLAGILLICLAAVFAIIYTWLVFGAGEAVSIIVIKLTVYFSMLALFGVIGYIGYVLATTPSLPPEEIERMIKELEKEEEMKKQK